ncbi:MULTISPECIES: recombinase family protein [Bacillus]
MLDTLTLLDKFEDYGVKFISYSKNFDTSSPIGRLVVQLMALLPKWNEIHCLRTLSLV